MKNIKLNIQRFAISADVEPYLEFEDYPSTKTPLSATNLNNMQRKIKDDISAVQKDISDLDKNKVDKITGKGLSTNDYTNAEKEKLASLSDYDDTDVKKDISDLKDSQDVQDTKIEALEEENKELNELVSQLPTTEEESSNITLKNTLKAKLKTFEVEGKSEQNSYSGKNKANTTGNPDFTYFNTTQFEKDGATVIVKNSTTSSYSFVEYYVDNLKPNTTYTISFDAVSTNNGVISADVMKDRGSASASSRLIKLDSSTSGHLSGQFTTPSDTSTMCINLYSLRGTYYENASVEYSNIQIEEGSSETSYEPYVGGIASPSSNYPQEVKSVSGIGNIYDSSFRQQDDSIYCVYGSATENNGEFTLTATDSNMYIWAVKNEGVAYDEQSGKLYEFDDDTYIVSISNSLFTKNYITYYDENKVSLGFVQKSSNVFSFSKGDKTGAKYFTIRIGYANSVSGTSYKFSVQLEKGSVAHQYVPYGHWLPVKISNKNKFDGEIESGSYNVSTGVKTSNSNVRRNVNIIPVKPNATYIFSQNNNLFDVGVLFYNKNNDYLSYRVFRATEFTTPNNCYYINFFMVNDSTKVQLEEGNTATSYTPHEEETTLIDLNKYDSNNNIIGYYELCSIDDIKDLLDIKDSKAILSKNISKIAYDGTENWTIHTTQANVFRITAPSDINSGELNIISNITTYFGSNNWDKDSVIVVGSYINIKNSNISTVENFKAWLEEMYDDNTPVMMSYPSKTPQEIELKGTYNLKTYEEVTHIEILDDLEPNMIAEGYIDVVPILENLDERLKALEEE